jgi:O-antigen/teichoic acid export membrane protein
VAQTKTARPLVERAGRAAFFNAIFFPVKVLIGFVASVVVVRGLRTEGFYVLSIVTGFLSFLGLLSDLGIERTLPRFYPEIEMRYGRRGVVRLLLWVALIKGAALLLLLALLVLARDFWIAQFKLGENGNILLVIVGVLLLLGAVSDVTISFLYTHFRQRATNLLSILASIVNPSLTAAFILLGWGVFGPLVALVITTIISSMISLTLAVRMLRTLADEGGGEGGKEIKTPSRRSLRDRLVSFSGLNYLINWTAFLYDLPFIVLVINLIFFAPDGMKVEVAIVSLAFKFTQQFLRALMVPLTGVQTPLFARLYAEGRIEGFKTAYATITKFLVLGLVPACIGLILLSRNVLQLVYLQIGRDAVLTQFTIHEVVACTAILAIGLFGEAIISVALNVLLVHEDYRAVITARLLALVSVVLLFVLVPQFGAVGAAIAAASAGLLSRSAALFFAIRRVGVVFPGAFFVRVGTASAVMGAAMLPFLTLPVTVPVTLLMFAVGVSVFYAAFRLLGGMDESDKERFRALRVPFVGVALRYL